MNTSISIHGNKLTDCCSRLKLWRSKGKGGAKQVQLLQETGWFDWFHLSMREPFLRCPPLLGQARLLVRLPEGEPGRNRQSKPCCQG